MAIKVVAGKTKPKKDKGFMADAVLKTKSLERKFLSIDLLVPNPLNPNEMSDAQFNMLVDNFKRTGFTDPVFVRPHPEHKGKYRIVGGHHRYDAAKLLGFTEVPCTINTDPAFDDDQEKFQSVRHNVIKGKLSPGKFLKLYESLSKKYAMEIAAESFGFADADEFQKLLKNTMKGLPTEMQAEFKEASKELKTIDDLAKLLNHLFTKYGDTLAYGYMILDVAGKDSVWIRMSAKVRVNLDLLTERCLKEQRALDHVMEGLLAHATTKEFKAVLDTIYKSAKQVQIKAEKELPTLDNLM